MDKDIRNRVQRATQAAREVLEHEYAEQLEGVFDIRLDGAIAAEPGEHLEAAQRVLRNKIVTAVEHQGAHGTTDSDAVAAYLREAAFTTLNRFVALKMLEARDLVRECISRGDQSAGFKEFTGLAPGLVQLPDHGYRMYIEALFDEIGREVGVLFDRRDQASLLWPRRQALLDLLHILNATELNPVWAEDEMIGWVYQYFNSDEERRQMRAESQAPRNSRELAVRNQFFTPRYIVQFLTDNTLGRIWYEMRQGATQLRELQYLVRRPKEVFLDRGEEPPAPIEERDQELSQEEMIEVPLHVPFRVKKDPRDIRILDPACGSGHFLLYAFDLLVTIYEEAWADDTSPASEATGASLRADFPELELLRAAMPGLILWYNLHGVDIDARCVQIAALALWMRAQRAYKDLGIGRELRREIKKTNIVTAEPMPGEPELREEFIATLDSKLGQLVEHVFERMELAGEAGSLLGIEEDIRSAGRWIYGEVGGLFRSSDEERWRQMEEDVLRALHEYSNRAINGRAFQRRLFAEDSAQGLGFIHICQKRYDVALMNPPFGLPTNATQGLIAAQYQGAHNDLFAAMVRRSRKMVIGGMVGVISSRSFLVTRRMESYRREDVLPEAEIVLDLGIGVMDEAFVESAALVLRRTQVPHRPIWFFDCRSVNIGERASVAVSSIAAHDAIVWPRRALGELPKAKMLYGLPFAVLRILRDSERFEPEAGTAREGMKSFDNSRFLRLTWEVPAREIGPGKRWQWFAKGGSHAFFYADLHLLLDWRKDGAALKDKNIQVNGTTAQVRQASEYWFRSGSTYSRRSAKGFSARVLPAGCVFTDKGPAVLPNPNVGGEYLLGWLNSRLIRSLVHLQANASDFLTGILKTLPWHTPDPSSVAAISTSVRELLDSELRLAALRETSPYFEGPQRGPLEELVAARWRLEDANQALRRRTLAACDEVVARLYRIPNLSWTDAVLGEANDEAEAVVVEDIEEENNNTWDTGDADLKVVRESVSYAMGVALGRWSMNGRSSAENHVVDPFMTPPSVQPAAALEAEASPESRGILADDEGGSCDVVAECVRILVGLFELPYEEAVGELVIRVLGASSLREFLAMEFWELHLMQYARSRRKAPIYWQLATPSVSYSVWLYYHSFTRDTFYRMLNEHVTPKLKYEESNLARLTQGAGRNPSASRRHEIDVQDSFVAELRAFHEEVARVAPFWNPNLNDGVLINFAPLWRLVPQHRGWQKQCKQIWDELVAGNYDWARLAMYLWPERVVPKCAKDRSLAIAHDLEDVFWYEDANGKWKPRNYAQAEVDELIDARTSTAVKDALKGFLEAPVPVGGRANRKKVSPARGARSKAPSVRLNDATPRKTEPGGLFTGTGPELLRSVKKAIGAISTGASKSEVIDATGITADQWNRVIRALLADGAVTRTGERRGARYHMRGDDA